ncbi:Crp/Fnr family transcriptional regulator [Sphingomonas sp. CROZ-RG-20F-R02-07]|uniref:Crp/Fnr family transcriptional regulator n=1 Tax=Sphingomonas sp. CROZ-RG-20F-R02-07 TaxID=2914832 RepID=UPI001F571A19|nr:Crp/Fnr family transcriptional regulator [Sphingomonas sp. CROZ-RG-20F-R02-07]
MSAAPRMPTETRSLGNAIGSELLLRRLRRLVSLNGAEINLVLSLNEGAKTHGPGSMICPKADGSPHPRLIASGWACRPRILPDGRRQMLNVLLPGDLIGDRGERRPLAMNPAVALTTVRSISASKLYDALLSKPDEYPQLCAALGRIDRMQESHLLDHIVRLGCQTALQRTAHCLLELHARLEAIGFTHDGTFPMPLTQETLGDLLGLSLVHVNRIMAQLKRDSLIRIRSGVAIVEDFTALALLADRVDPTSRGAPEH